MSTGSPNSSTSLLQSTLPHVLSHPRCSTSKANQTEESPPHAFLSFPLSIPNSCNCLYPSLINFTLNETYNGLYTTIQCRKRKQCHRLFSCPLCREFGLFILVDPFDHFRNCAYKTRLATRSFVGFHLQKQCPSSSSQ